MREREQLRDLFGRHVGEDVARLALKHGVALGGEEREAAALFVDVIGSTTFAATRLAGRGGDSAEPVLRGGRRRGGVAWRAGEQVRG